MKISKFVSATAFAFAAAFVSFGTPAFVREYKFTAKLHVPQVLDNSDSLGYRKYKAQTLRGTLVMEYAEDGSFENIRITDVTNWTFKVQKKRVGYLTPGPDDEPLTYPTAVWIGDNLTGVFKTGSVCFSAELFPDYAKNVSTEITSDNSFVLQFSGRATSKIVHGCRVMSRMKGSVTGTQGCGCMDFGHKSPTRADSVFGADCDHVIDKAGVDGVWTATLRSK